MTSRTVNVRLMIASGIIIDLLDDEDEFHPIIDNASFMSYNINTDWQFTRCAVSLFHYHDTSMNSFTLLAPLALR